MIGSRIIQEIEAGAAEGAPARVRAWLSGIRAALDEASAPVGAAPVGQGVVPPGVKPR